jgi:exopolysaccharide biosynthesis polyprenyl glycosylphosphotransferase
MEHIAELVQRTRADDVIVALRWLDATTSEGVNRLMLALEREPVNIRVAPNYSEIAYFQATPEDFNGITLVGLREDVLSPTERIAKRLFDLAFSSVVLLLTAPLMLAIAIAIRLDSPGPAIFRQPRIGQHGRRFIIYKFRTMYVHASRITEPARPQVEAYETAYDKRRNDPRVTRVGRFLRRSSLDELPQFFNVLKGEMSVVGPRPEVTWLADRYEWWQRKRFEVPQGITGWWQVNGRSDKPLQFHIEDDLYYVRNYSFWLDMQIVLRTLLAVISGRGAY